MLASIFGLAQNGPKFHKGGRGREVSNLTVARTPPPPTDPLQGGHVTHCGAFMFFKKNKKKHEVVTFLKLDTQIGAIVVFPTCVS